MDATRRLLSAAADRGGRGPLPWIAAPLQSASRVLDLCCGSGPLADELAARWIGVDARPGPGRPRLRGTPSAVPVRTDAVDGLALLLALPHLPELDAVFAEIRRVLRPAGTLVLLVPSVTARTSAELRYARVLAPVRRAGWTNRSALDNVGWLLAAADFAVLGDDRVSFALPLPDQAAARELVTDLPAVGLWPAGLHVDVLDTAAERLAARAGPGRTLPVPMRRVVARR